MLFESKLPCPARPSSDVFNYIFHHGRRAYPWQRVIYRVDKTNKTLTLAELEDRSRRFASSIISEYDIKPNDVVAIFAKDEVLFFVLVTQYTLTFLIRGRKTRLD